ncbi:hypothetical protein ABW21_db0204132 [Orbilia brochopaga]|nr:hypothetical protein ABW21_db0204132 [Drechslerella brochopaga]
MATLKERLQPATSTRGVGATGNTFDDAATTISDQIAQDREDTSENEIAQGDTTAPREENAKEVSDDVTGSMLKDIESMMRKSSVNIEDVQHSYRMVALLKIIDLCIAAKEKLLVFSQSLKTLDYIQKQLEDKKIRSSRFDGKMHPHQRQREIRSFNEGEILVYLISIKSGGVGLNIQSASRVVIFDSQFSPQEEEQAVGRAYRLGQKQPVFVYRFCMGGTFEDVLHNNSLLKKSLSSRMVDKKPIERLALKMRTEEWLREPQSIERNDHLPYQKVDEKVLDYLLSEDWMYNLTTEDTYEAPPEEELTADQQQEYEELLEAEEKTRAGSVGARGSNIPGPSDIVSNDAVPQQIATSQDVQMIDAPFQAPMPPPLILEAPVQLSMPPPSQTITGLRDLTLSGTSEVEGEPVTTSNNVDPPSSVPTNPPSRRQKKQKGRKQNKGVPSTKTVAGPSGYAADRRRSSSAVNAKAADTTAQSTARPPLSGTGAPPSTVASGSHETPSTTTPPSVRGISQDRQRRT